MEQDKKFTISKLELVTAVSVQASLGRILLREEVKVIAKSFRSRVNTFSNFSVIDVIPPIPEDKLDEFGQALVDLAKELDPTPPPPTYQIT